MALKPEEMTILLDRATGGDSAKASFTVGRVVRLRPPSVVFEAALTVLVSPSAGVAGSVSGVDRDPPGWGCDSSLRGDRAGLLLGSGRFDWDSLVTLATGRPGAEGAVVYTTGDTTVYGGRGQGLLLVDGNLTLGGGFEFEGAVIVRGVLSFVGSGAAIRGGVIAASALAGVDLAQGGVSIGYSSCALARAFGRLSRVAPLDTRSWASLY